MVDGERQAAHATWATPARRLPDTRRVEGDRLDAGTVERPLERMPHLDVAADAHDEQQRPPRAADGGADTYPVDLDEADTVVTRVWSREPRLASGSVHPESGRPPRRRRRVLAAAAAARRAHALSLRDLTHGVAGKRLDEPERLRGSRSDRRCCCTSNALSVVRVIAALSVLVQATRRCLPTGHLRAPGEAGCVCDSRAGACRTRGRGDRNPSVGLGR